MSIYFVVATRVVNENTVNENSPCPHRAHKPIGELGVNQSVIPTIVQ